MRFTAVLVFWNLLLADLVKSVLRLSSSWGKERSHQLCFSKNQRITEVCRGREEVCRVLVGKCPKSECNGWQRAMGEPQKMA